jgi:hypothetical protein
MASVGEKNFILKQISIKIDSQILTQQQTGIL